MQANEITSRNEFQYANTNGETTVEPVIQNVWSQNQSAEKSECTSSHNVASEGEAHFTFSYERPSMLATQQLSGGTRIATTDGGKISYIHIAPKVDGRRPSYSGSISENNSSSPSNSPEGAGVSASHVYGESQSPLKVGFEQYKWCLFTGIIWVLHKIAYPSLNVHSPIFALVLKILEWIERQMGDVLGNYLIRILIERPKTFSVNFTRLS